jgi:CRISPR-associated protein Csd2
MYWWQHNNPHGQYSSAKVHRAVGEKIRVLSGDNEPNSISDYYLPAKEEVEASLPGLPCEVIEGE